MTFTVYSIAVVFVDLLSYILYLGICIRAERAVSPVLNDSRGSRDAVSMKHLYTFLYPTFFISVAFWHLYPSRVSCVENFE